VKAPIAQGPGSPRFRRALVVAAAIYLAGIWLEVAGAPLHKFVPRPLHYFMQVAKLFPHAVPLQTEFRAEGWSCADHVFRELDVRPYFPIRPNDKENRFERAMFFYRRTGKVMHALDDYLVTSANRDGAGLGGVRLLSLRIPIPPPGEVAEPYRRKPLDQYPADYRKVWYQTPAARLRARCEGGTEAEGAGASSTGASEEMERGPASP
jgi:hypothetical protein